MRLTIKAKLAATFAVVVALSAGSMLIALQNLGQLNGSLREIVDVRTANSLSMAAMQARMESIGSRSRAQILTDDAAVVEEYVGKINGDGDAIRAAMKALDDNISDPEQRVRLEKLNASFDAYWQAVLAAEEPAAVNSDKQALAISRSEGSGALGEVETT
ncbi:MAG TPA: MCP four helix bundle domain-containing protein, partial [Devosia sp.]